MSQLPPIGMKVSPEVMKIAEPKLNELKKATEGFETIFMKKLFTQMKASVKETNLGGQSFGKDIYEDMYTQALAENAAKSHSLGMGDMMFKQFAPRIIAEAQGQYELSGAKPTVDEQPKSNP